MPDPLAGLEVLLADIGGLGQTARVRRGMWLHATLPRPPVATTPHDVIHRQGKLAVRYYAPTGGPARQTPIVVIPSMINRASICDLEPDRSLVAGLAALGQPVYLIDWGVPGPEDAAQDVATTLDRLLHRSIQRTLRHARATSAVLLGYCQGGTLAAMYAARHPSNVAALTCLATPVRFSEGGRFARFCDAAWCDVDALVGSDGLVGTELMGAAFKLLDPMGNWTKYLALEEASRHPAALARALTRERWLEENVPLPGVFAREFIVNAYQHDKLLDGTWQVAGETVDLRRITCPLLVTPCERDFIAPPAACLPLATATGSRQVRVEVLRTGHIGVVVGGFGPKVYYPLIDNWCREAAPDR